MACREGSTPRRWVSAMLIVRADQTPPVEGQDAVGQPHHLAAMGHDHQGLARPAHEPIQGLHDRPPRVQIEVAGRLVAEEHIRFVHQGPGYRDALLLPTG